MKKAELKYLRRVVRGSPGEKETDLAKQKLERFIESVPDDLARHLLRLYLINGLSWQGVAMKMGWSDESTPRKIAKRFMK